MNGPLKLALKYIGRNKLKFFVLVGCLFLTALLPIAIKILISQFNEKILQRADRTPIVIGAKGSDLDLTLHALYFKSQPRESVNYAEVQRIRETGYADAIPIHSKFTARGQYPIVGTSLDYFQFRQLRLNVGTPFTMLGDCVLGARVAEQLNLEVGDHLLSDRESVLDIAGLYPLKMNVTGVLMPENTADDWAVFVDLKTTWVIQGLGHGHQELAEETDEGKILSRDENVIVASAAVLPFTEITNENLDSFHFHGDSSEFPITAILAVAPNIKSATLLQGQYDVSHQLSRSGLQFVQPGSVVRDLMKTLFRIKLFFDANTILIAVSTTMLMVLVVMLSIRLRREEMHTMFKIGCSRGTIFQLQFWEMAIVFFVAVLLVGIAVLGIWGASGNFVLSLLVNSRS